MDSSRTFWTRVWFGPLPPGWCNFFDTAARRFAVYWPMVVLFSVTGSVFMSLCVLVSWLLSGRYAEKWRIVRDNPVALASLAMGALSLVGCLYTSANRTDMLKSLDNQTNYFALALCVTLFDKAFYRDAAIAIFQLGAAVLVCIRIFLIVQNGNEHASGQLIDYVTFGLIVITWMLLILYRPFSWKQLWPGEKTTAISASAVAKPAAAFSLSRLLPTSKNLVRPILVLLLILFLLGVNPGRTNYLCLMAVLAIVLVRSFQWKAIAKGSAVILAFLLLSTLCFPLFRERCLKAYREAVAFHEDHTSIFRGEQSSIGRRLFIYEYGLKTAREHPFFGTGTGSVSVEYGKQIADLQYGGETNWRGHTDNLHCEFLMMLLQYGIVGLIGYLAWLGTLWRYSARLVWPWNLLARCMAAMVTISTLSFSHMSNARTGCFYALMMALFYAVETRSPEKEPPAP